MKKARLAWAIPLVVLSATQPVFGQGAAQATAINVTEMKFVLFPGLPTCAQGAVEMGDPSKGASILMSKMATGCVFPWHWHTPTEHVMLVSGSARMEMKGSKTVTLKAGGFALLPSHHVHQFTCDQTCSLYIYSDAAFDMHYVDAQGRELTPADALKAVKETAATAPPTK